MADYAEIRTLYGSSSLRNRTTTAVMVAARSILNETLPREAKRTAWANKAFSNPVGEVNRVLSAILAASLETNPTATPDQIKAVVDADLQTSVDAAVGLFIDADAGV